VRRSTPPGAAAIAVLIEPGDGWLPVNEALRVAWLARRNPVLDRRNARPHRRCTTDGWRCRSRLPPGMTKPHTSSERVALDGKRTQRSSSMQASSTSFGGRVIESGKVASG
jgi:hypothetical protein